MRGFWYTLEAIFAGIVLIGFLIGIGALYFSPKFPEPQPYIILKGLDEQGILRSYVVSGDYEGLNNQINTTYNHSIEICEASCIGQKPDELDLADAKQSFVENVYVGRYFISGESSYNPKEVRLYLWT